MITIGREICRDLDQALTREWLVTNGLGGYASATIAGTRTRRYHGLLVAALQPPLGRTLLLAKINEEVEVNGLTYRLGTDEYQNNTVSPDGFLFERRLDLDGMIPTMCFEAGAFKLSKTIWMEHGRDTSYVHYELGPNSPPITLTLLPFCTYRDSHSLTIGSLEANFGVEPLANGFRVTAFEGARPFRVLAVPEASLTPVRSWYWRFQLRAEAERGLESYEDLYLAGLLRARLAPGECTTVVVTLEPDETLDLDAPASRERARRRQEELTAGARDEFERQLFIASDQFLVARPDIQIRAGSSGDALKDASTVIAGYHWFGDWGRDTMISLEGLTLVTGRLQVARRILLAYAQVVSDGMLPNRFVESGMQPEYNTVDATLWYFHAVDRYVTLSGDRQLLRELCPVLRDIIRSHIDGTRHNIHMDRADGLISAGEEGVQLTWMDAKVGDWVVTPRIGKPVEINALWYNALRLMQEWGVELGDQDPTYARLANMVSASFERYWYTPGGYLFDVIDGPGGNDPSLRPNQLFALSLPHSPVPPPHAKSALEVVTRELLTPYGLRTLTPRDPNYHGRFTGDQVSRDAAYHNGTVWPWLMGAYVDAHRRVYPEEDSRRALFTSFQTHLGEGGIGTISECFEGDPPHRPVACIAQAWSVAEILRAYRATMTE